MPLPVIILFLSSVGWGLTWLPIKWLNEEGLEGPMLIFIAFAAAALVLLPGFFRQRTDWNGNYRYLFLIALFGGFANLAFQNALFHGDVVRVMILFYLLPVWSVLGGKVFLKEEIDGKRILAVLAALTGAFLILGGADALSFSISWIDLLAIGSGMAFAMNNIAFRATPSLPIYSKVTAMFTGCAVLIGGYLVFSGPLNTVNIASAGWAALYGVVWLSLITFGTQWGVTHLEAGRAAIIIVMELLVAVVSAVLILGQDMSLTEVLGGVLVLSAALLEGMREEDAMPVTAQ